ncbi:MAG: TetR family transcriptional regulator C-terminal domain-containing protein [Thermodesulfovibrionales bacterium]|nr:TetR family transcriptional regulator C-terminal domain-containing protein [Thermodesulfovibrionales bacterium]
MSAEATKRRIVEAGAAIVHAKGFQATGIHEVLEASQVAKGSFYFYFRNKAAFGMALLEYFEGFMTGRMEEFLSDVDYRPVVRLARFFGFFHAMFEDMGYREGCPIGNMAQEMADNHPEFRDKIESILSSAQGLIAGCLREALEAEEVPAGLDPDETAAFILNSWEGAMLRMKAVGGEGPLRNFEQMVFGTILRT